MTLVKGDARAQGSTRICEQCKQDRSCAFAADRTGLAQWMCGECRAREQAWIDARGDADPRTPHREIRRLNEQVESLRGQIDDMVTEIATLKEALSRACDIAVRWIPAAVIDGDPFQIAELRRLSLEDR